MTVPYVLFVATNAAVIGPNNRATGFFFPEIAHPFGVLDGDDEGQPGTMAG